MLQRTDTITGVACLLTWALPTTAPAQEPTEPDSTTAEAEGPVPARVHVRHVAYDFRGTPNEQGLMPTAVAEAEIAHRHAALAAQDPNDAESVALHARHVIHALDPAEAEGGPGLGYGLVKAAERTAHYTELATRSDGAADGIATHGPHVIEATRNAEANARITLDTAREILERTAEDTPAPDSVGTAEDTPVPDSADAAEDTSVPDRTDAAEDASAADRTDAAEGEPTSPEEPLEDLVARLEALTAAVLNGADLDGDGRVEWSGGEGGLAQATTHLDLLIRAEGIAR